MRTHLGILPPALALLALWAWVRADYILGPPEVNQILKKIQSSKNVLDGPSTASDKAEALFQIALQGNGLARLINAEIQSHGLLQKPLIDLALAQSRELGVDIRQLREKSLYLYDDFHFEAYLKAAPRGSHAAEARFALMEKSSSERTAGSGGTAGVLRNVDQKKQFLKEYPRFGRRADVEMLLALDYFELYSIYLQQKRAVSAARCKLLTSRQCRHIVKAFPGTDSAAFATELLMRLDF